MCVGDTHNNACSLKEKNGLFRTPPIFSLELDRTHPGGVKNGAGHAPTPSEQCGRLASSQFANVFFWSSTGK